jgi:hypothetical protein
VLLAGSIDKRVHAISALLSDLGKSHRQVRWLLAAALAVTHQNWLIVDLMYWASMGVERSLEQSMCRQLDCRPLRVVYCTVFLVAVPRAPLLMMI